MVVAVLASPEDAASILPILEVLRELGIKAFGLKLRENWKSLPRAELEARVGRLSNIILVCSPASVAKSWFPLAIGIGMGKRSPAALYRVEADWKPERWLQHLPILDDLEELRVYYRVLEEEWEREDKRREARAALLEMGVSYHAESFAECVREGKLHAVGLFLDSGLPADSRDRHGVPLLCLAARHRHRGVAERLLEAGGNVDILSEDRGYTPLMDAVQAGSQDLVELFLSRGASLDLASKDGQTALVIAVGRNDAALSARLLEKGAGADIADKLGLSARKYARLFKNAEILALLSSLAPEPPAA